MKIEIYNHKKKYLEWRDSIIDGIPGLSKASSDAIIHYLSDMQLGLNVASSSVKGPRSYSRLCNLQSRMIFIAKQLEQRFNATLADVAEEYLFKLFNDMRDGSILRPNGKVYRSVADYVKTFKAFWHWHTKVCRKRGVEVLDITVDLDASREKPRWVYLSEEQVRELCDNASLRYRTLIMFLYDTGIRSPTELMNLRVADLNSAYTKLKIRDETVKRGSFGRTINLMICSNLLKRHIEDQGLTANDQIFKISPSLVNRYLKRLAKRVLGDGVSAAGEKYSNLSMYDFRHCSCCYWLPRYKSESGLKYRFGWKKSDKIHYYSELLGMKDTINEEDMLVDLTKTEIERRLLKSDQRNDILQEKVDSYNTEVRQLKALMQIYLDKFKHFELVPICVT